MIRLALVALSLMQSVASLQALAQTPMSPTPMLLDGPEGSLMRTDMFEYEPLRSADFSDFEGMPFDSQLIEHSPLVDESPSTCDGWDAADATAIAHDCPCQSGACQGCQSGCALASHWTPWQSIEHRYRSWDLSNYTIASVFRRQRTRDRGLAYERVMFAPSVLDTAINVPHVGFRYQLDYGLQTPDRAEYLFGNQWVSSNNVGLVDTQDFSVRLAIGNEKAMAITQYTLRSIDPDTADNTTGMGDMMVGAQALLVDGQRTKVATIFRTYLATGPEDKGLGTGHTSLEPGLLGRYCCSPETYLFGEVKYWIPIAGTSEVDGDVLSTGFGISTIAAESDVFACMPTFEIKTLTFLFGGQTESGSVKRIDGLNVVELYPGARFAFGSGSDLGLWEFGCAAGITLADDDWFDTRAVFDLRLCH